MNCCRKIFITAFALAASLAPAQTTLELGNFTCPLDALEWMRTEVNLFQQAHPELLVRTYALREPPRYRQPIEQLPRLPHVFTLDSEAGYEIQYLVEKGLIVPPSSCALAEHATGVLLDQFPANLFDSVTYQGEVWAVPWLAWTELLVINRPMFEAAGLAPPQAWPELYDTAVKLTRDMDGDGAIDQWGLRLCCDDETLINLFVTLVLQQNGSLFSSGRFRLSSPAVLSAMDYLRRLVLDSGACSFSATPNEEALLETPLPYAMILLHSRSLRPIAARPNLEIVPLPSWNNDVTAATRRLYLAVRRGTPAEEAAAWQFVAWLTRTDVSLPETWGCGFPCRSDFTDRSDFLVVAAKSMCGLPRLFDEQARGREWGPFLPGRKQGLERLQAALEAIVFRGADPALELPRAEREANLLLRPLQVAGRCHPPRSGKSEKCPGCGNPGLQTRPLLDDAEARRIWAEMPELLTCASLRLACAGALERAGFPLEAELMEQHGHWGGLGGWVDALHQVHAPSTQDTAVSPRLIAVWRLASAACEATHGLDIQATRATAANYLGLLDNLQATTDAESLRLLRIITEAVFARAWCLLGVHGFTFDDRSRGEAEIPIVLPRLFDAYVALLARELASASTPRDLEWAEAVERAALFAEGFEDPPRKIRAYCILAEKYPTSTLAAEHLLHAALLAEEQSDHSLAIDLYHRLSADFAASSQAPKALRAETRLLLEADQAQEALARAQLLQVQYPETEEVAEARFLAAQACLRLGLEAQAREEMETLALELPGAPAASRALYWLSEQALQSGDIASAQHYLQRLTQGSAPAELLRVAQALLESLPH
ncbi:MAG: extracellular solute-binding protein [Candidatus Hydrogenedentes bacterium]|nr:extracellular solute-binding protein [Candidatus Hydrogenedentota bacterium]